MGKMYKIRQIEYAAEAGNRSPHRNGPDRTREVRPAYLGQGVYYKISKQHQLFDAHQTDNIFISIKRS